MLRMERQPGEIDVLAGDLDLVHRRVAGRHLDQRLRIGEPPEVFLVKLVFAGFESGGETFAVARGLGDDFDLFRAGFLEQHRLFGAFDDRAQARQRHRLVVDFDFADLDQAIDEIAQAVFVEIEVRGGAGSAAAWVIGLLWFAAMTPSAGALVNQRRPAWQRY